MKQTINNNPPQETVTNQNLQQTVEIALYKFQDQLIEKLDEKYVNKNDFSPVKSIVYGMVGLVLTSVAVAIVAQVVKAVQ